TKHGALIAPDATVIQVDRDEEAIGAFRRVDIGVVADARETAELLVAALGGGAAPPASTPPAAPRPPGGPAGASPRAAGRGRAELAAEIAAGRWRDEPYEESRDWLDPRTLSIALDEMLPEERIVCVDSGAFMGYPAMYMGVPDAGGFVFPQAFQCVGLGLGC